MKVLLNILLIGLLFSCKENTQVNTISGRIFIDCEVPLVNAELALKTNVGGNFQDPFIIGSAISEADGSYSLSYQLEEESRGSADLLLIQSTGFETLLRSLPLNQTIQINLSLKNESEVFVNFSSNQALGVNDTLFYATNRLNQEHFVIQPMTGNIDTLKVGVMNQIEGSSEAILYYGLGKQEFTISKNALSIQDSSFQHLPLTLFGCGDTLSTSIFINN